MHGSNGFSPHSAHRVSQYLLVAIALSSIALHLSLVWAANDTDLWSASCLFWAAAGLIYRKHISQLQLVGDRPRFALGIALYAWLVFKSWHVYDDDVFLRLFPLIAASAFSLIATSTNGSRQLRQLLYLLSFLAIPWEALHLLNITHLTARVATSLLDIVGLDAHQQGFTISVLDGAIEVYDGCSGVKLISQLLGLAWVYLSLMPHRTVTRLGIVLFAALIGFVINSVRVALLALFAGLTQHHWLEYWHQGDGSLLFPLIAVSVFGTFLFSIKPTPAQPR